MSEEKYADYIEAVLKECPEASPDEIAEAFSKYETEFIICITAVARSREVRGNGVLLTKSTDNF